HFHTASLFSVPSSQHFPPPSSVRFTIGDRAYILCPRKFLSMSFCVLRPPIIFETDVDLTPSKPTSFTLLPDVIIASTASAYQTAAPMSCMLSTRPIGGRGGPLLPLASSSISCMLA
ncbi:unnamed protein product, partial [Ectocarpus sp. 12 AP-2014]